MCGFVVLGQCARVRVECSVVPAFLRLPAKGVLALPLSRVFTTFAFLLSSDLCREVHAHVSSKVSFFTSIVFALVGSLLTPHTALCCCCVCFCCYVLCFLLCEERHHTLLFAVCVVPHTYYLCLHYQLHFYLFASQRLCGEAFFCDNSAET